MVSGVDYVADEIAVLGNDLPEELRASLGDTGERVVDELIRADLPDDQIETLLQSDDLKTGIAKINDATNRLTENPNTNLGDFPLTYPVDAAPNIQVVDDVSSTSESVIFPTMNVIGENSEPTALQVGTAGLGKVQQKIDTLEQENPIAAQALNQAINIATGGPLKAAIGEAITYGVNQMVGDTIQNIGSAATSYIGATIQEESVPTFNMMLDSERSNANNADAPLGTSAVDTVDGVRLGAVIAGVGGLIKRVKKGDGSNNSATGSSETGVSGTTPRADDIVTTSTESVVTNKTVGRWMSPDELAKMKKTGKVQESRSGTTHVADPANPEAFIKQTKVGNQYVEFDVPASSLKTNEGWAQVVGPNSATGRLAARKGNPVPQMPSAENIVHKATKIR